MITSPLPMRIALFSLLFSLFAIGAIAQNNTGEIVYVDKVNIHKSLPPEMEAMRTGYENSENPRRSSTSMRQRHSISISHEMRRTGSSNKNLEVKVEVDEVEDVLVEEITTISTTLILLKVAPSILATSSVRTS